MVDGSYTTPESVGPWLATLETRHLADLTFQEVSRSLRALSSAYVERRSTLAKGGALNGAGKRAAFALFYGPLHLLLVNRIVQALGRPFTEVEAILDLGCGTGVAGAGWALACHRSPRVTAVDRHPWAVDEARRTLAELGVRGSARMDDLTHVQIASAQPTSHAGAASRSGQRRHGVVLAYAVNEIEDAQHRDALRDRLLAHAAAGGHLIVVEPLAGFVAPWWGAWQHAFESAGGRADEWRFDLSPPSIVDKLARSSGLNARELKARTLSL